MPRGRSAWHWSTNLDWSGAKGPSGSCYICARRQKPWRDDEVVDRTPVFIPVEEFRDSKAVIDRLARGNIPLLGPTLASLAIEESSRVKEFPQTDIVEHVGWNEDRFALGDGTVITAKHTDTVEIAFERGPSRYSTKGRLKRWNRDVASLAAGQHLLTFALALAFAPPLMRFASGTGNIGFEFVGPGAIGKSTAMHLVASVWGGAGGAQRPYWTDLTGALSAPGNVSSMSADQPLPVDGADRAFAGQTAKSKADYIKTLGNLLRDHSGFARHATAPASRLILFSTSRLPLVDLGGEVNGSAAHLSDYLYTVPVALDRLHGVFDFLPPGHPTGGDLARALRTAMSRSYGTAGRQYLKRLVGRVAYDEAAVHRTVVTRVAAFHKLALVDQNDGEAVRAADAFGLIFAAGQIAKKVGALPAHLATDEAVLTCYRLYKDALQPPAPFAERLISVSERSDVINLGSGTLPTVKKRKRKSALAYLRVREGRTQLFISTDRIHHAFSDWDNLKNMPDVRSLLQVEKAKDKGSIKGKTHRTVKRQLGAKQPQQRVYCFNLPRKDDG